MERITVLSLLSLSLSLLWGGCSYDSSYRKRPSPRAFYITKKEFWNFVNTGIPEEKIEKMLLRNPRGFVFTAQELLELRKKGVSNHLIRVAMHPERFRKKSTTPPPKKLAPKKGKDASKRTKAKAPEKGKPEKTQKASPQKSQSEKEKVKKKKKYPSLFYYGSEEDDSEKGEEQ